MQNRLDNTFLRLLHVFLTEVLTDFLRFLSHEFKMPASIWIYDVNDELVYIEPKESLQKYTKLCRRASLIGSKGDSKATPCENEERTNIDRLLSHLRSKGEPYGTIEIVKCYLAISKLVFPIVVDNKCVGALCVGQFRTDPKNSDEILMKTKALLDRESANHQRIGIKPSYLSISANKLLDEIQQLPVLDTKSINRISANVLYLLPLLEKLYKYNYPQNDLFDGVSFFESIEKCFNTTVYTEYDLWDRTNSCLELIVNKLHLNSGNIFYSCHNNYQDFLSTSKYPVNIETASSLQLVSSEEFLMLDAIKRGLLLPTKRKHFGWLKNRIRKTFAADTAIIYGQRAFAGRMIIIGFGFDEKHFLDEFERLLLKESVNRLFRHIHYILSTVELDHLMAETGHMLQRSIGDIEAGINSLFCYGTEIDDNDPPSLKDIKSYAPESIKSGLFRMKLIMRNFDAFSQLRVLNFDANMLSKKSEKFKMFDIVELIRDVVNYYDFEFKQRDKTVEIHNDIAVLKYKGHESLFELLFLNIIDNANKFSFDGTCIKVKIKNKVTSYQIVVTNTGMGVPEDEYDLVFKRYYQSRFRDSSKKREGSGYGLCVCKRYIDSFVDGGKIRIVSIPKLSSEDERFEGDKYTTSLIIDLPKVNS